jgi:hypothetical protein
MPDRVDATVDDVEHAALDAVIDRRRAEPDLDQLLARDNAFLAAGEGRDLRIDRTRVRLTAYIAVECPLDPHGPIVPGFA